MTRHGHKDTKNFETLGQVYDMIQQMSYVYVCVTLLPSI